MLKKQDHSDWMAHVMDLKEKYPASYCTDGLSGPFVVEEIYRQTKGDAIMVTEVGQHQMWTAQYYKYAKPHRLLTSGGLGTMGYGLGAAIGAQIGNPDKQVVNVAGDGCFRMNMNEVATAVRENLPLIEVIINNHVLGMVRQWQELFFNHRYSFTQMLSPDFGLIAKANGIEYSLVEQRGELDDAVSRMLMHKGPYVMEVRVENEENVFPMVPAGAELSQIMLE